MATKQLETISGAVEQVNSKQTGIKLLGEWLNISQYHPIAVMPTAGELVEAEIERTDKGVWINSLRIIGGAPIVAAPRDREIRRMACLKAAATFAAGKCLGGTVDLSSQDVIKVAGAFEKWVLES